MSTNNKWGALSMRDRAFLIREAVRNGVTDIGSIRDTWEHRFDGNRDIVDGGKIPSIVVTPDPKYTKFVNSLPDNQRDTPESKYYTHLGWRLYGKPKNFEEAKQRGLYQWDNSDSSYHGVSVGWDDKADIGYFLKPKHHETVKYELDWYNKGLETLEGGEQRPLTGEDREFWQDFKSKYKLEESESDYKYIPRHHTFEGNSSHPTEDHGIWDTIKGWFSKEEPKYITKDNYKEELSKFRNAFEEYHPKAYWDSGGKKWTVGTGFTYLIDDNGKEIPVRKGQRLSEAENQEQIIRRVNRDEDYARKKTPYWDKYHPELKFQILEAMYNVGNANVWEKSPKYQRALRKYEEAKGWRDRDYDLKDIFQHADWNLNDRKWLGVRSSMRRNPQAINPDDYSKIYYNHFRDSLRTVYDRKFKEK